MLPPSSHKSWLLAGLLIALIFFTVILSLTGGGDLAGARLETGVQPVHAPVIGTGLSVFFTDPANETFRGGPETGLIQAIDGARAQVDVAAYDLNLWGVRDALIAAARRGVAVRVVIEADHRERPEITALAEAGIPIVGDLPDALMHNKFVIIDRSEVWTGSMNFTINGAYRNDNTLLVLSGTEAAGLYQAEFEEMYTDGLFGAYSPRGAGTAISLQGPDGTVIPVEIYFSPDDGVKAHILELLDGAERSVHVLAFAFTLDELGDALIELSARGVAVQGVFDEEQARSNIGGEYDRLFEAGLDIRRDGGADKLHHKLIVIDGRIVITGSYNFSVSAETRNDENVVILFDERIAEAYLEEFQRIYSAGR